MLERHERELKAAQTNRNYFPKHFNATHTYVQQSDSFSL